MSGKIDLFKKDFSCLINSLDKQEKLELIKELIDIQFYLDTLVGTTRNDDFQVKKRAFFKENKGYDLEISNDAFKLKRLLYVIVCEEFFLKEKEYKNILNNKELNKIKFDFIFSLDVEKVTSLVFYPIVAKHYNSDAKSYFSAVYKTISNFFNDDDFKKEAVDLFYQKISFDFDKYSKENTLSSHYNESVVRHLINNICFWSLPKNDFSFDKEELKEYKFFYTKKNEMISVLRNKMSDIPGVKVDYYNFSELKEKGMEKSVKIYEILFSSILKVPLNFKIENFSDNLVEKTSLLDEIENSNYKIENNKLKPFRF